jgi:hypothetical protein
MHDKFPLKHQNLLKNIGEFVIYIYIYVKFNVLNQIYFALVGVIKDWILNIFCITIKSTLDITDYWVIHEAI